APSPCGSRERRLADAVAALEGGSRLPPNRSRARAAQAQPSWLHLGGVLCLGPKMVRALAVGHAEIMPQPAGRRPFGGGGNGPHAMFCVSHCKERGNGENSNPPDKQAISLTRYLRTARHIMTGK